MTIIDLKNRNLIVLECISGSKAYGLQTPDSDTDIKGVYVLPRNEYYGLDYVGQINNASNDIVYYELKKFIDLLTLNNPNILELLATPEDSILYKHPLMEKLKIDDFLSKQCKNTFSGYAMTQIKKAKGLKKKIVNPVAKKRKLVLDFCYVIHEQGSIPVLEFLKTNNMEQQYCGLSKIPHMHETYGLYYDENSKYQGLIRSQNANDISLSSISKGIMPVVIMSFNKTAYSKFCKEYKEYWDWVNNRNEKRYKNTIEHGKNYDAKNMMHTFRLLAMAYEIGRYGKINVRRPDREFLLKIKNGEFEYSELLNMAEQKMKEIEESFIKSTLADKPDREMINKLLIQTRKDFYKR